MSARNAICTFVLIFSTLFFCSGVFALDWKTFCPEEKSFCVEAPGKATTQELDKDGLIIHVYEWKQDTSTIYQLVDGISARGDETFDGFVHGYIKGVKKRFEDAGVDPELIKTSVKDGMEGEGWSGRRIDFHADRVGVLMTALLAQSSGKDMVFTLTVAPASSDGNWNKDGASRFFSSLKIDQKLATRQQELQVAEHLGYKFGYYIVGPAILILFVVGLIVLVKRRRAR